MIPRPELDCQLPPGTGPRHAVFFKHNQSESTDQHFLLVVVEVAGAVAAHSNAVITLFANWTTSDNGTNNLLLNPAGEVSTLPGIYPQDVYQNAHAAEIKISPDNRFVTVSNRNVTGSFNSTAYDSLVTFNTTSQGHTYQIQTKVLDMNSPRGFEFHPSGDYVLAVGGVLFQHRCICKG